MAEEKGIAVSKIFVKDLTQFTQTILDRFSYRSFTGILIGTGRLVKAGIIEVDDEFVPELIKKANRLKSDNPQECERGLEKRLHGLNFLVSAGFPPSSVAALVVNTLEGATDALRGDPSRDIRLSLKHINQLMELGLGKHDEGIDDTVYSTIQRFGTRAHSAIEPHLKDLTSRDFTQFITTTGHLALKGIRADVRFVDTLIEVIRNKTETFNEADCKDAIIGLFGMAQSARDLNDEWQLNALENDCIPFVESHEKRLKSSTSATIIHVATRPMPLQQSDPLTSLTDG